MLLFQITAIVLAICISVTCEEPTDAKDEIGKQPVKRHLLEAFMTNPKFQSVFQSANPEDSLVTKFLGQGSHRESIITQSGNYVYKIPALEETDDEDYQELPEAVVDEEESESVNNLNELPGYYYTTIYKVPGTSTVNLEIVRAQDTPNNEVIEVNEDTNEIEQDGSKDFNFNNSTKSPVVTPTLDLTPPEYTEKYPDNLYNKTSLEIIPAIGNNTSIKTNVTTTEKNETYKVTEHPVENAIQVSENLTDDVKNGDKSVNTLLLGNVEPEVGDVIVNRSTIHFISKVEDSKTLHGSTLLTNRTLYLSPLQPSTTAPKKTVDLASPSTINSANDIPEDYHRVLTPHVNTLVRKKYPKHRYNNRQRRPRRRYLKKIALPQNSNNVKDNSFLDNLVTYFIHRTFFNGNVNNNNNNQNVIKTGLRQTTPMPTWTARPTNKFYYRLTNRPSVQNATNRVHIDKNNVLTQTPTLKNIQKNLENVAPMSFPNITGRIAVVPNKNASEEVYPPQELPQTRTLKDTQRNSENDAPISFPSVQGRIGIVSQENTSEKVHSPQEFPENVKVVIPKNLQFDELSTNISDDDGLKAMQETFNIDFESKLRNLNRSDFY